MESLIGVLSKAPSYQSKSHYSAGVIFNILSVSELLAGSEFLSIRELLDDKWKQFLLVTSAITCLLIALILVIYRLRKRNVYLLDFACYKPAKSLNLDPDMVNWAIKRHGLSHFGFKWARALNAIDGQLQNGKDESAAFQNRISKSNGLGKQTYAPPGLFQEPPSFTMDSAREEAKMVLFGSISELLNRTNLKPKDIDFLVVNCSLFNPTPSLSAMVVNQFKMRSDIITYNLGGMGCSAGIISIDLAKRLLEHSSNKFCLILSTENISQNWYGGQDRSMLIPNTLFRMGSCAAILTNKESQRRRSKYQLEHVVRVHLGADPVAYRCVYQEEDAEGNVGVALNKNLMKVVAIGLEKNLRILGRKALPASEKAKFVTDLLLRHCGLRHGKPYQPDFRKAFQHFCLHTGGRGVIECLGGQMKLSRRELAPSFSSLYWYGNTSSASYWYGFGFAESKHGMKKGDRVWQVGFGSGFKTNSAVWKALKTFQDDRHKAWAHIGHRETAAMWADLEAMGVKFENDIMPPYNKTAKRPEASKAGTKSGNEEKRKTLDEEAK